ncbi:CDP-alcohol phosphatidyltransferase family protein [Legionella yabuuchiae]|uniref:CDP-alcohol phosphatidyltransferase family protein n=1 Tax=Legionella yabuuchiae TaxID=376727 RepID=UPI00105497BB|nr:CDP-alcohol phosphatidyltransferase family protein [Legionella yabuuchiae]
MIEQSIRQYYQALLVDPSIGYLKSKISPNAVTVLSGLFGILVLPALWFNHSYLAVSLLLLSGYCDTLDGTLARFSQKTTAWGSVLDIMMDRMVEFVVVFALWSVAPDARGFWCIVMLGSMLLCITSFLVVGIFSENHSEKGFYYSPGIMERAEAFIFFMVMMLWPSAFTILALLFSLLVLMTAGIRLYQFYNQTKG